MHSVLGNKMKSLVGSETFPTVSMSVIYDSRYLAVLLVLRESDL